MNNFKRYLGFIIVLFFSACATTDSTSQNVSIKKDVSVERENTPEDIVNQWLQHAKKQNWEGMAKIAQMTWVSEKEETAVEEISSNYDFFDIKSWRIISSIKERETFYIIKVEIETQLGKKTMEATVIKEISPYQESINGKWGINPFSAVFH